MFEVGGWLPGATGGEVPRSMNVTVILCTFNRCQSLAKALESVAVSTLPKSIEWEVLVVDNNSRDQTRKVVEEFCRRYPGRFRYLFESQQGKSHALNSGIREARGNILAFMDDDVRVEPTWLGNLTAALAGREWAGAGGRILPQQTFSAPCWLALEGKYSLAGMLAFFDLGNEAGDFRQAPFGITWLFKEGCLRSMATFAQTWALAQVVRYAMRTQSSVVACWLRESVCVMNLRPSFTTPGT